MSFSLIVPIAADKKEYEQTLPYVFSLNKEGLMVCIKSILGLNLKSFDSIYFTILKKHSENYFLKQLFDIQFKKLGLNNAKVVLLNEVTDSQAETVYQTIISEEITGGIFIKDADGYFSINEDILYQNNIAVYPLEKMIMLNPQNKSYVAVDEMNYITNIIEKKVISHLFNAGGYCFESSEEFCLYYKEIRKYCKKCYLSHLVYKMLLDKRIFRPLPVCNFIDLGNELLYRHYQNLL